MTIFFTFQYFPVQIGLDFARAKKAIAIEQSLNVETDQYAQIMRSVLSDSAGPEACDRVPLRVGSRLDCLHIAAIARKDASICSTKLSNQQARESLCTAMVKLAQSGQLSKTTCNNISIILPPEVRDWYSAEAWENTCRDGLSIYFQDSEICPKVGDQYFEACGIFFFGSRRAK